MSLNEIQWDKLHLQSKAVQFLLAAVVALVIVVAGYFVLFQSQWDEYKQKQDLKIRVFRLPVWIICKKNWNLLKHLWMYC